jgi:uncharacterized protein (DUF58 family)
MGPGLAAARRPGNGSGALSIETARLDALALAGDLPGLMLDARRLAASAPGFHGRRRAGMGEAFWQYRDYHDDDSVRLIDWRRSGRGDRYYVRERELEAAQTAWFWLDHESGFNWSGAPARPTKQRRALVIMLALAILLSRGGERVGALGARGHAGQRAPEKLALDLAAPHEIGPPPRRASIIFASDFYAPILEWRTRLADAASAGATGALLLVADPAEEDFPFQGRTLFQEVGGRREALLGRAENAREEYAARLSEQRRAIRALGAEYGFPLALHRTDHSAAPTLALLSAILSEPRR